MSIFFPCLPAEVQRRPRRRAAVEQPKSANEQNTEVSLLKMLHRISLPTAIRSNFLRFSRRKLSVKSGFMFPRSVITQYEDDMDVPTFLRKQMQ